MKSILYGIAATLLIIIAIPAFGVSGKEGKTNNTSGGGFYLVSIGIGDPDNITLRAVKTIQKSDIVFCSQEIRKRHADLLEGKDIRERPGNHLHKYLQSVRGEQMMVAGESRYSPEDVENIREEIDAFVHLVKSAVREGKTVSVLDYGDPAIYGPQIWMVDALREVDPVVIPGVSSLNAANAALKKGVTWGLEARSAILTHGGGLRDNYTGKDTIARLAANRSSMVFFTMHVGVEEIAEELMQHYPAETPIAVVIEAGYIDSERVIMGTLESISDQVKGKKIPFKNLIYVGDFLKDHWDFF